MILKFDVQNCYGIGDLRFELDYGNKNIAVVYAPNGTMKTSLTKTIAQLLAGKKPCDDFYKERESHAAITIDDVPINKDNTFVFQNDDADGTKQISTFLANAELKGEYDAIFRQLDSAKKALKKSIKNLAKSSDCEDEILAAFKENEDDNYFDCLIRIREQIEAGAEVLEYDFKFNDVFEKSGKVREFILENRAEIQQYFEKYTELLGSSDFFSSGVKSFGTSQANSLMKSVDDDRFFLAEHKMELKTGRPITSKADMKAVINDEMARILTDDDIKRIFNSLESKLDKNQGLKAFKDVIQSYPDLIAELADYNAFQQKILRGYFSRCKGELDNMVDLYTRNRDILKSIVSRANEERSEWERVIDVFRGRFFVPFKLDLQNKSDILLNTKTPELEFLYQDGDDEPVSQERKTLVEHLSTGERKAFFILQNLFELEARLINGTKTLLVFDDIADSFDYKNKYAIVEYLNDLKINGNFSILILTHNFDFYRTVVSRLEPGGNIFFADKKADRSVKMCKGIYKTDILKNNMLSKLDDRRAFISCIPFVRNLIEYTKGDNDDYKKLTACLHMEDLTAEITLGDIQEIYYREVKDAIDKDAAISFKADNYLAALFEEAEAVMKDPNEVEIVNKLVLSMAIRLKAEEFMNDVLTEDQKGDIKPKSNRTAKLVTILKKYHYDDMEDQCLLMNKVLMLTSENIHMNNFMFEPLVDISILYLKQLYEEVKELMRH
jgi:hypothetical protein